MIEAPSQGANFLVGPREDQWFLPTVSWPTFLFRPECHIWTMVFINFQNQVCPPPPQRRPMRGTPNNKLRNIANSDRNRGTVERGASQPALEKPLISQEEGLAAAERPLVSPQGPGAAGQME